MLVLAITDKMRLGSPRSAIFTMNLCISTPFVVLCCAGDGLHQLQAVVRSFGFELS
jgi:hypothetical protein